MDDSEWTEEHDVDEEQHRYRSRKGPSSVQKLLKHLNLKTSFRNQVTFSLNNFLEVLEHACFFDTRQYSITLLNQTNISAGCLFNNGYYQGDLNVSYHFLS